jgi:hypothetical protein
MSKDTARERIAAALDKVRLHGVDLVLVMFASGLIAAAFFTTEPERQLSLAANATEVWTDKPVKVTLQRKSSSESQPGLSGNCLPNPRHAPRPSSLQMSLIQRQLSRPCRPATNQRRRGPRLLRPMSSGVRADTLLIAATTTATLPIVRDEVNAPRHTGLP